MPRQSMPDGTLGLLRDGYEFIRKRSRRAHSDVFETRLMLEKVLCMRGREAAELFYSSRFRRHDAAPRRVIKTLFGEGGVQSLDGQTHRRRKELFMSCMSPDDLEHMAAIANQTWASHSEQWQRADSVVLHREVIDIHCQAALQWCGIPGRWVDESAYAEELAALVDGAGAIGVRHWRARMARSRLDRWLKDVVEQARRPSSIVAPESILYRFVRYRDGDQPLPAHTVAVELNNLLRPIVAVSWYVTAVARAIVDYPDIHSVVERGDSEGELSFINEVRRLHPFFPFVAARVDEPFHWHGYHFPKDRLVLLDLYGTNRDSRLWPRPDEFDPDRFRGRTQDPFDLIPQGGGNHFTGHRCAGEWLTVELMRVALRQLVLALEYDVPAQDLRVVASQMPAFVESGFVMCNVRRIAEKVDTPEMATAPIYY